MTPYFYEAFCLNTNNSFRQSLVQFDCKEKLELSVHIATFSGHTKDANKQAIIIKTGA